MGRCPFHFVFLFVCGPLEKPCTHPYLRIIQSISPRIIYIYSVCKYICTAAVLIYTSYFTTWGASYAYVLRARYIAGYEAHSTQHTHCCLGEWQIQKTNRFIGCRRHICKKVRLKSGSSISSFIRFSQHLTALRTWCKQCLPGR